MSFMSEKARKKVKDDLYGQMNQIFEALKANRAQGENPVQTMARLLKLSPADVQRHVTEATADGIPPELEQQAEKLAAGDPTPLQAEQPATQEGPPRYRFRTYPDMDADLSQVYGQTWQNVIAPTPGLLESVLGVTPDDDAIQAEMHRVYSSGSDQTFSEVPVPVPGNPGRILRYNRQMIEPV
jgi:hypothetical protein